MFVVDSLQTFLFSLSQPLKAYAFQQQQQQQLVDVYLMDCPVDLTFCSQVVCLFTSLCWQALLFRLYLFASMHLLLRLNFT